METETVITPSQLLATYKISPLRAKTAYIRIQDETKPERPKTQQANKYMSQSFTTYKQSESPTPSFYLQPQRSQSPVPSAQSIPVQNTNLNKEKVVFKNQPEDVEFQQATNERLYELEKTNLNLRRMLQLIATDPLNNTQKLLPNRQSFRPTTTVPKIRQGRIGSSWRHIKQTNNYSGSNLLFIDGTVRIDDSLKYPPKQFGYPPKIREYDQELIGLTTQSLNDLNLPIQNHIRNRSANLKSNENVFHEHAKQGFEYWLKDRRLPENNKPKAKLYTTGSYKTFYGLGAAPLKL